MRSVSEAVRPDQTSVDSVLTGVGDKNNKQKKQILSVAKYNHKHLAMFLCLFAGILLAKACLADDDQLLEMSVDAREKTPGYDPKNSAFITDGER